MTENITLRSVSPINVVKRREDGSGVVEIMAATPVENLNAGRTETGKGPKGIPVSMLREMVENFDAYPGPVSIGVGTHLRDAGAKAPGFVESATMRGDDLWLTLDLSPALFREVVEERGWRGFSIEGARDPEFATTKIKGWALTGGIFTNRPALPVEFQVAASSGETPGDESVVLHSRLVAEKEIEDMSDEKVISLAAHEAKLNEAQAELAAIRAEKVAADEVVVRLQAENKSTKDALQKAQSDLDALSTEKMTLSAKVNQTEANARRLSNELNAARTSLNEAEAKLEEIENATLAGHVKSQIKAALGAGIKPALFDGWEADPVAYMRSKFGSKEYFDTHVTSLLALAADGITPTEKSKSGHDAKAEAAEQEAKAASGFTPEELAQLKAKGVVVGEIDFTGCNTEEEVRARIAAASK